MVILVHTAQSVKTESLLLCNLAAYAQMGVQLFFVASAFTLCHSWQTRQKETNRTINFAIRRFFRIAPMYYIGIMVYWIITLLENYFPFGAEQNTCDYSFLNVIVNILFLHGFYPPANNSIVPGGWSIGTEMAFYALFPILMGRILSRKPTSKLHIIGLPILGIILSQVILFVLYQFTGEVVQKNNFLYFNIVNQLPVFLIGVSLYLYGISNFLTCSPTFIPLLLFFMTTFFNLILWKISTGYGFIIIPFLSGISFVFLIKTFEAVQKINFQFLRKSARCPTLCIFSISFLHTRLQSLLLPNSRLKMRLAGT